MSHIVDIFKNVLNLTSTIVKDRLEIIREKHEERTGEIPNYVSNWIFQHWFNYVENRLLHRYLEVVHGRYGVFRGFYFVLHSEILDENINPVAPYIEIRSRDIQRIILDESNKKIMPQIHVVTYGLDEFYDKGTLVEKTSKLKEKMEATFFKRQNYDKQIGINEEKLEIATLSDFEKAFGV